ncbi:2-phospho-L-lactate guanylyltransferase [Halobacteria archaeon AArc-dxtr1]|nr:2-phospho-L-lactate guanylyltransferase [Halobacteria archaeon AArc-dxtr1]
MHVVVPYAADTPKTRLEPALDAGERRRLARTMLEDVIRAIRATDREPTVLATGAIQSPLGASVTVDDRPLTEAVNAVLGDRLPEGPVAIVMADLALATPDALGRLFDASGDVVVAPGRGVGTNAIVVRHPSFRVDYHGGSFVDHEAAARECGAAFNTVDSRRLGTDIDEPADLVEAFVHGPGRTPDLLRTFGFELDREKGRVSIRRSGEGVDVADRSSSF